MRVGTVILLLLLALVGFGFFLAHSINLSNELTETRNRLAQVESERRALETQYQALMEQQKELIDQVASLTREKEDLQAQMNTIQAERQLLISQIEVLRQQLNLIRDANPILARLTSNPTRSMAFAILLIPIVPLSMGAIYLMNNPKAAHIYPSNINHRGENQTTCQAALTRDELHFIAMQRRARTANERVV